MNIKYQNKLRLARYIKENNGIDGPAIHFRRHAGQELHEYKRQLMNILHVMYLYNQLRIILMDMIPRTFIFSAKRYVLLCS